MPPPSSPYIAALSTGHEPAREITMGVQSIVLDLLSRRFRGGERYISLGQQTKRKTNDRKNSGKIFARRSERVQKKNHTRAEEEQIIMLHTKQQLEEEENAGFRPAGEETGPYQF